MRDVEALHDLTPMEQSGRRLSTRVPTRVTTTVQIQVSSVDGDARGALIRGRIEVRDLDVLDRADTDPGTDSLTDSDEDAILYRGVTVQYAALNADYDDTDMPMLASVVWPYLRGELMDQAARLRVPQVQLPLRLRGDISPGAT